MPSGSFQHLRSCALNAARSAAVRFAAVVDSESNPSCGAFGRSSSVGMFAGSKIDGRASACGTGVGAGGVCGPGDRFGAGCGGSGCGFVVAVCGGGTAFSGNG